MNISSVIELCLSKVTDQRFICIETKQVYIEMFSKINHLFRIHEKYVFPNSSFSRDNFNFQHVGICSLRGFRNNLKTEVK